MNQSTEQIVEELEQIQVVPVIVLESAEDAVPVADALCKGGIPCAEVTFRTQAAAKVIRQMTQAHPEMLVGAGTVLTIEQVDEAVEAGAKFIVSPGLNPEIVTYCKEKQIPMMPGVVTPSEVEQAMSLGLRAVKFFPAEAAGGLKMLKSMTSPYGAMRFMPTGGITMDNMCEYLECSFIFCCGGSFLVTKDMVEKKEYHRIEETAHKVMELLGKEEGSEVKTNITIHLDREADPIKKVHSKMFPEIFGADTHKAKKVVTLGEIMLRLEPDACRRFVQAEEYQVVYGGSEANVAVSLANFGIPSTFVTKLPDNDIAQAGINYLRAYGVDTSHIVRGGNRMGIYFIEKGASQRPSKVVYDRAGSSMSEAVEEDFDWDEIFKDAMWFHFSGITVSLSEQAAVLCEAACREAKKRGIYISCDANYRKNLGSLEQFGSTMKKLSPYLDAFWGVTSREYLRSMFGIEIRDEQFSSDTPEEEKVAATLSEAFDLDLTVITKRNTRSASDNDFSAMLYQNKRAYRSQKYSMHIVDRVGGGDAFAAGLIYSQIKGYEPKDAIEFAAAAACLKHSIEGDSNLVTATEVEQLALGNASGAVQR